MLVLKNLKFTATVIGLASRCEKKSSKLRLFSIEVCKKLQGVISSSVLSE